MNNLSTIKETHFTFGRQTNFYSGKVRDVYEISGDILVMIASDRISAFDVILPEPIPGKGAILTGIATHFLHLTKDIVPNWLLSSPEPRVAIGYRCKTYPVEMVIRGYLCGHALREYKAGRRTICGVSMPDGMKPYEVFPEPIITPSTKAAEGHDEDISREEIIANGIVSEEEYAQLEKYTRLLYNVGNEYAAKHGLILADTKYEFGNRNGVITLIDEIHTPDSSRYFYKDGFDEHVTNGTTPQQLSKEFVREWLMENGFQGKENQQIPVMTNEVVDMISLRYRELYKEVMGKDFYSNDLLTENDLFNTIEKELEKFI